MTLHSLFKKLAHHYKRPPMNYGAYTIYHRKSPMEEFSSFNNAFAVLPAFEPPMSRPFYLSSKNLFFMRSF